MTDIYLRFADATEAKKATGAMFVADPVVSKEIAITIAKDRYIKASLEFSKTPIVKERVIAVELESESLIKGELILDKPVYVVDAKAPITEDDLNIKFEEAELKSDWAPEELPPDGKVLGYQFDIVPVGVVYDVGEIDKDTGEQSFTARTGYHVIARFRGGEDVPENIKAYETTPWNQILG
jgi:hypothetical protein